MGRRAKREEELAAATIGSARIGHAQRSAKMHAGVVTQFVIDLVSRAASSITRGIATLSHESWQDAVEGDVVIKTLLHQADKIADGSGSLVFKQLDLDIAFIGL